MESNICDDSHKDTEEDEDMKRYIEQLSPQEKKVLEIARDHLETSFNIAKSIGYMKWKSTQ